MVVAAGAVGAANACEARQRCTERCPKHEPILNYNMVINPFADWHGPLADALLTIAYMFKRVRVGCCLLTCLQMKSQRKWVYSAARRKKHIVQQHKHQKGNYQSRATPSIF